MDPIDALRAMAKCWTGNSFSPPDYYMGHSEMCGGKGNDRACSCASNQSRGAFIRGRAAITSALQALEGSPLSLAAGDERQLLAGEGQAVTSGKWNLLVPIGTRHRGDFGEEGRIEFTATYLQSMVDNWKRHGSPKLNMDYFHLGASHVAQSVPIENKVSSGDIVDLELRADGLYAKTEFTARAKGFIDADELKRLSPYFQPNPVDRLTGKRMGPQLWGAGLLNDPFFDDLPKVAASSTVTSDDDTRHVTSRAGDSMLAKLIALLSLSAAAKEDEVEAAVKKLVDQNIALSAEGKTLKTSLEEAKRKGDEAIALAATAGDAAKAMHALKMTVDEQAKKLSAMEDEKRTAAVERVVEKLEAGFHIKADDKDRVRAYAKVAGADDAFKFFSAFKNPVAEGGGAKGLDANDRDSGAKVAASAKEANDKLHTLAASMAGEKKIPVHAAMDIVMSAPENDQLVRLAMQSQSKREF